ncbi:MAG: amidohydrolase [Pseudomonadota bacterium]
MGFKGELAPNSNLFSQTMVAFASVLSLVAGLWSSAAKAQDISSEDVIAQVEEVSPVVIDVASRLWHFAEISLLEIQSSALLKDLLVQNGFEITADGVAGVPTAFVAEYGSDGPVLGIMLEYDALPGLGNAPVPMLQPRADGTLSGHGCGHNLIGAGSLGAAIALKGLLEQTGTPGRLRIYGGASEETEGAKVYMARAGLFDDVDAMLHWHPAPLTGTMNVRTSAQQQIFIEFQGKTAHAGNNPWDGRSALDAVELFLHGVNAMREHVKPTARIHYIIRDGGQAANIVPDYASVQMTFRDATRDDVLAGVEWLEQMAEGAALMTQTTALFVPYYGMHDLLPNTPLAERMQSHLEMLGAPEFSEEEQEFARTLQSNVGLEPTGMSSTLPPLVNEPTTGGSTDVGDVSWLTPTMGVVVASIPENIGLHTWMATASHGTTIGDKAAITAAKSLALLGWDILTDEELRAEMRADFERRTDGFTYVSPIPDFLMEPVGLPEDMRSFESVVELRETLLKQQSDHEHTHGDHFHSH